MKFLFVLEHFEPYLGGAEKLFGQVTKLLIREGHEVEVVTTRFRKNLSAYEKIDGVGVRRVRCYNRFLFTVFSLPTLLRAARRADIIHTTTYNAALPAWLVGKIRRKPIFITYHEHWGALWFELPFLAVWQRWLFFLFERTISRLPFDRYVAVSEATRQRLIGAGIAAPKIHHIYNGIDYDRFAGVEGEKSRSFSLVYYGRLGVSKGLDLLLPAWGALARHYPTEPLRLRLVIPTYPKKLFNLILRLIETHCPTGSVELLHELPAGELFMVVKASHAVVIPSYSEGFCFVAAEAVALGMPIVSSGRGALPEVVSGKFVEYDEQTVAALTEALFKAYRNDWEERPVRHFTLAAAGRSYLELYRSEID